MHAERIRCDCYMNYLSELKSVKKSLKNNPTREKILNAVSFLTNNKVWLQASQNNPSVGRRLSAISYRIKGSLNRKKRSNGFGLTTIISSIKEIIENRKINNLADKIDKYAESIKLPPELILKILKKTSGDQAEIIQSLNKYALVGRTWRVLSRKTIMNLFAEFFISKGLVILKRNYNLCLHNELESLNEKSLDFALNCLFSVYKVNIVFLGVTIPSGILGVITKNRKYMPYFWCSVMFIIFSAAKGGIKYANFNKTIDEMDEHKNFMKRQENILQFLKSETTPETLRQLMTGDDESCLDAIIALALIKSDLDRDDVKKTVIEKLESELSFQEIFKELRLTLIEKMQTSFFPGLFIKNPSDLIKEFEFAVSIAEKFIENVNRGL